MAGDTALMVQLPFAQIVDGEARIDTGNGETEMVVAADEVPQPFCPKTV